ncbi:hypothetical protein C8F01DRAFT_1085549 [Mycena amicta]|nr:hypothetical protein C8F01DRAFT_1085549 [Mycena amicta]
MIPRSLTATNNSLGGPDAEDSDAASELVPEPDDYARFDEDADADASALHSPESECSRISRSSLWDEQPAKKFAFPIDAFVTYVVAPAVATKLIAEEEVLNTPEAHSILLESQNFGILLVLALKHPKVPKFDSVVPKSVVPKSSAEATTTKKKKSATKSASQRPSGPQPPCEVSIREYHESEAPKKKKKVKSDAKELPNLECTGSDFANTYLQDWNQFWNP